MDSFYEENFRLRISDFDCYDRLSPCCILDLVQDVAGKHADLLNIGYNDFIKNNRIWVLLRTRFEMINYPSLYATLKVRTWPREKGRVDFDRDTVISDENGNAICKVQSKWVIIDSVNRRLVLPRQYNYPLDKFVQDKTFEMPFDKLEDFSIDNLTGVEIETKFSDLDHNGHVNNVQYVKYIMDIIKLDKNYKISNFEINYIHELKAYEKITIYVKADRDTYHIKAISKKNTIFISKINVIKK